VCIKSVLSWLVTDNMHCQVKYIRHSCRSDPGTSISIGFLHPTLIPFTGSRWIFLSNRRIIRRCAASVGHSCSDLNSTSFRSSLHPPSRHNNKNIRSYHCSRLVFPDLGWYVSSRPHGCKTRFDMIWPWKLGRTTLVRSLRSWQSSASARLRCCRLDWSLPVN
jgi:hypothetical protein